MNFSKYSYSLLPLIFTSLVYAAPIESVSLSQVATSTSQTQNTPDSSSTPESVAVPANLNWQLMQQNQKLDEEVRRLRGALEEDEYTIQQLKKDLDSHYSNLDQRLQIVEQRLDADEKATASEASPSDSTSTSEPTAQDQSTPSTTQTKGDTSTNNQEKPMSEKDAYTVALTAYKQGGAKQAISPMEKFIKNYPNSVYIANAHFWLAEFNLAIEPANYATAKQNYEIVAKQYPQSEKASRALYQLYSIAKEVDHNAVSAKLYKQQIITKYPKSKEAGYFKP
ncbi:YbgF trimerization domain-containing protein [Acinetobacter nectaris]|uniref:YbgF trimerization domain-containing protein n=1 Tax=Acinetobacter nectaris TaxID=1219382 RepID=UPI001EFF90C5|nr:YbgF trimerization domain-containing protein [Acinetobacter nectaris]MCF9033768.1 tetratricopeptide repeat protein [Acinetobacter nectaris]